MDNKEDLPVDKCHHSMTSTVDFCNAILTENANENIPLSDDMCQANAAVAVDVNNDDHSHAASMGTLCKT